MYFLFWTLVLVVGIYFLFQNRDHQEEWLVLKLLGYYILGSFYLNLNGLVLPLGFAVSLFLKPRENRGVKRGAAVFGLVMMIIGLILR
ncbi:hypothetical protein EMG79_06620 [Klebsiella pneumoniae]|uniref:Uncharacterized protein n=1 Tax=Paenibacillus antri TaxID=2582848 RepID=A0A5R9GBZ0_9BACL|nr:hypothetical protein [Paenibacillus antri]TLS51580.1 hypothetical protein FE782_13825 [Paenibacillus antri]TMY86701.1 hypothetical protein EMG79_06620 [Klebsiella pneumoniae]